MTRMVTHVRAHSEYLKENLNASPTAEEEQMFSLLLRKSLNLRLQYRSEFFWKIPFLYTSE